MLSSTIVLIEPLLRVERVVKESRPLMRGEAGKDSGESEGLGVREIVVGGRAINRSSMYISVSSSSRTSISSTGKIIGTSFADNLSFGKSSRDAKAFLSYVGSSWRRIIVWCVVSSNEFEVCVCCSSSRSQTLMRSLP